MMIPTIVLEFSSYSNSLIKINVMIPTELDTGMTWNYLH